MRVLLLSHRFAPALGGVETWTQALASGLTKRQHEVLVLSRDDRSHSAEAPFSLRSEPKGAFELRWIRHLHSMTGDFRQSWADARFREPIERTLEDFDPDLVHVAHPDGWGVIPFRLALARRIPTVATLHDYKWICARGQMVRPPGLRCEAVEEEACVRCIGHQLVQLPARGLLRRLASQAGRTRLADAESDRPVETRPDPGPGARRRWRSRQRALLGVLKDADAVTSPSRFVAERLRAAGLDRPIAVIPNGLGQDEPPCEAPTLPAGHRPLRIGFFGRPHPTKGLTALVTAFASLPGGAASLELHGAAASDLDEALPPGATAHGPYAAGEVHELMTGVDIVALPSLWDENHPMVAVEANRARRSLVVSDLGGLPECVRPDLDGWVLPAGDVEAWGEQLALLAANPALVARYRAHLPAPRSEDSMAEDFEDAYLRLLHG